MFGASGRRVRAVRRRLIGRFVGKMNVNRFRMHVLKFRLAERTNSHGRRATSYLNHLISSCAAMIPDSHEQADQAKAQ